MTDSFNGVQISKDGSQPTEESYNDPKLIKDPQVTNNNYTYYKTALDGGWGWVVMCATIYLMFMASIPSLSFGILFSNFLIELDVSSTTTAWIFNMAFINSGIFAFLIGPLVSEFGWRRVGLAVTIIFSAGFILSSFATSPHFLMFSFSILAGSTTECLFTLSYVVIPSYFQRWRNIANSITTSGLCLGQMVMPLVITYLQEEYSFRGATLLTGALCLNGCAAAMVLHPVQWHKPSIENVSATFQENFGAGSYLSEYNKITAVEKAGSNMQKYTEMDSQLHCKRNKLIDSAMQEDSGVNYHLVKHHKKMSIIQSINSTMEEDCRVKNDSVKGQQKEKTYKKENITHKKDSVIPYHPKSTNQKDNTINQIEKTDFVFNPTGWPKRKYSIQNAINIKKEVTTFALDHDGFNNIKSINQMAKLNETNCVKIKEPNHCQERLNEMNGVKIQQPNNDGLYGTVNWNGISYIQSKDQVLKKDKIATQHGDKIVNLSSVLMENETKNGLLERREKTTLIFGDFKTGDKTMIQTGNNTLIEPITQRQYHTFPQTNPTKTTHMLWTPLQHLGRASVTVPHKLSDKINIRHSQMLLGLLECLRRISTKAIHNLAHLKSPIIVVLSLVLAIPVVVMFNVCALVPFAMKTNGFTQQEASFCLSVAGGCNLFSRLITGTMTWFPQVKIWTVYFAGTCLLFVCIMGFSIPYGGLEWKVVTLGLGSIGYGLATSLFNLLALEQLGMDLMLPCLCITGLAYSILHLILGLLTGLIRDISGSYEASLGCCAACVFLCIILECIIPTAHRLTKKLEQEKRKKNQENTNEGTYYIELN